MHMAPACPTGASTGTSAGFSFGGAAASSAAATTSTTSASAPAAGGFSFAAPAAGGSCHHMQVYLQRLVAEGIVGFAITPMYVDLPVVQTRVHTVHATRPVLTEPFLPQHLHTELYMMLCMCRLRWRCICWVSPCLKLRPLRLQLWLRTRHWHCCCLSGCLWCSCKHRRPHHIRYISLPRLHVALQIDCGPDPLLAAHVPLLMLDTPDQL
jgi:hypothetical protein